MSRKGEAVDMSTDHKPEDDVELARIEKAGGAVVDGRVQVRHVKPFACLWNMQQNDKPSKELPPPLKWQPGSVCHKGQDHFSVSVAVT